MQSYLMRVADLVVEVNCLFASTAAYCKDYLVSGETPARTVSIGEADLEGERQRLLSKKNPGEMLQASTPQALEVLVLCRKIAEFLPYCDRILFPGSTLAIDGQGVLFTAKSGTGKSTHTRLWRQVFGDRVRMINDDKPMILLHEKGCTVYGNPWNGKHGLGENISAPLKAIFFVTRGEENMVTPMTSRELLPLLLQQTYTPDDPVAMQKTLPLVLKLASSVQLYKLQCNMDPDAAETAFRSLNLE